MNRDAKADLRAMSVKELSKLLKDAELQLIKWNNVDERYSTAGKGKGHPYKRLKKKIAFLKVLLAGR